MSISIQTFFLDPSTVGTLQSRIRQMIAQGILSGRFHPNERLPSSRKMAAHLGVSRITVTLAYTDLVADDYLSSKGRSGYFVSENAPEPPKFSAQAPTESTVNWEQLITARPTTPNVTRPADWANYRYPFIYGQTDAALFDSANWRLCALQALGKRDFSALTADQYDGDDPELISFIARQILPRRGILANPDEILVTMGAQNALWLTAQVLLGQGKHATIEDPCYPTLRAVLSQSHCQIGTTPVDENGLNPALLPKNTDVVYTAPSHQSPTNATMPLARRQTLLAQAERDNFLIVEDDYEFEMSFLKSPSPALKSLDKNGRVLYVGSFSKSLFPGLRLGYLVGPAPFIKAARALRASVLRHPPGHIQRTVSHYLSLGHYDAQIRRMSKAYHNRRNVMMSALAAHNLSIAGSHSHGGSSIWMQAPSGTDTNLLALKLRDKGVLIEPGAPFFAATPQPKQFYRLAYSSIPAKLIPEGISRIATALSSKT